MSVKTVTATAAMRANDGMVEGYERSILAYLMTEHDACDKFLHRVSPDLFSVPRHRQIIGAIRDVHDERENVNHVTVANRLSEKGALAECGGAHGIVDIAISTTSEEIAESALDCVLDDWRARQASQIGRQLHTGEISVDEATARLAEIGEGTREQSNPLIEFRSPLQLKNFTPPPGFVLVGDCHIVRGSVFVIGGAPGVGKSRGSVSLAVAGAMGSDWFGLKTHRQFKTMITQTENGLFRLSKEFTELNCDALESYVRVCPPPPFGMCFGREDFRAQLSAAIGEFKPDVVIFDPWNAAARDEKAREYLETFDALRSVLPLGDDAPALGIVAHTRKPKTDERASGRALLNLLAGSYVLGSVPRTVFVMQAASDDTTDNRIVWTCCKNNDGELGSRSAWERGNGLFAPVTDFDWEAFDAPGKDQREVIGEADLRAVFENGALTKGQAVKQLAANTEASQASCYRALNPNGRFGKHLCAEKGMFTWR
jgi:DnaB-like helicase N terminal domain/AAA domain